VLALPAVVPVIQAVAMKRKKIKNSKNIFLRNSEAEIKNSAFFNSLKNIFSKKFGKFKKKC